MSGESIRILLIEDNRGEARLIQELLSDVGPVSVTSEIAGRLSEGLSHLGQRSADAVLLDLSLPDSDGLETLEAVRASAPDIPVVVLTGYDDESIGLEVIKRGAQDYLVKGFPDGQSLIRAIRFAIERHRFAKEHTQKS